MVSDLALYGNVLVFRDRGCRRWGDEVPVHFECYEEIMLFATFDINFDLPLLHNWPYKKDGPTKFFVNQRLRIDTKNDVSQFNRVRESPRSVATSPPFCYIFGIRIFHRALGVSDTCSNHESATEHYIRMTSRFSKDFRKDFNARKCAGIWGATWSWIMDPNWPWISRNCPQMLLCPCRIEEDDMTTLYAFTFIKCPALLCLASSADLHDWSFLLYQVKYWNSWHGLLVKDVVHINQT